MTGAIPALPSVLWPRALAWGAGGWPSAPWS